jgi:glucose-6-phosphate 1-dehydrogenase
MRVPQQPFVMVIFGATGDLARNKLIPALFSLINKKQLPDQFYIVGFSRRELFNDTYRNFIGEKFVDQKDAWDRFAKHVYYQQGLFSERAGYNALIEQLNGFDAEIGACITRLFYLATPPDNYEQILHHLNDSKLSEGCGQGSSKWTRIAIEKPFGNDLDTARSLDKKLGEIFEERQIFRVDHYLGKDAVQNIIAFRFANSIFEPVWNKDHIDHVQVTISEKNGIKSRGKFYDGVGNLRDVAQNHLLQLVASVAMEQPSSFTKEGVRDARAKAIEAIRCIDPREVNELVVRGQYAGYLEEKDVAAQSQTETFVAMKLDIQTPRFEGVPFYIRAGKSMKKDIVEIAVVFRQTCHILFKEYGCPEIGNVLRIRIQPDEGISLRVIAKKPGTTTTLGTVDMKFSYQDEFADYKTTDAYEKVLLDIFSGDQMLFNRSDELESSWQLITNILTGWEQSNPSLSVYDSTTFGPNSSDELIGKDGKKWL